ncbi:DUF3291 domain-containing protein [Mucilaginibacter ginkgonis]|uniref:DUF3291 domain-containing protein n=1 Tax=Mucilaginibacter ginkgonis TaxID=2682091 RepID=A0A6I4HYK2_9SPHI|nr:DUF3291 domain-containing protein [Mucilaginibacter ginkgonis]QQL51429.1 DUF3291 domain-containing protein [Mucilaginibacter ginkgonis]
MIVSLTIVRYQKTFTQFGLMAMALHRIPMVFQRRCRFWKLLGSGKNGTFDLSPDWQQWGLLAVWNNREDFDEFYKKSLVAKWWDVFAAEQWTILCEPLQSHGRWDGRAPFGNPTPSEHTGPVAVLTRATIRLHKLKGFWANVDSVAKIMTSAKGYVMSLGIGEAPVFRQATFSVWESLDDVKAFAYRSREHAEVIKKTRDNDWYSEELFARFKIIDTIGSINGADPLKGLLNFTK